MHPKQRSIATQVGSVVYTVVVVCVLALKHFHDRRRRITSPNPPLLRHSNRMAHINRILYGGKDTCTAYIRMDAPVFFNLVGIIKERGLLKDSVHVTVEEQLMWFLHTIGHNQKNRVVRIDFVRSGSTISKYFKKVLWAINHVKDLYMKQAGPELLPTIATNPYWYPFFKDCIGLVDGTHVSATIPSSDVPRFRGRKGVTQNVLAAVTPDMRFTYVLAGWEGSANDFAILKDALARPPPTGLRVIPGKYYLVDAGYTTMPGFIAPYRGVRYHLKEQGRPPTNCKELFNFRHSSLRSIIERTFGLLKNRFKILGERCFFDYDVQVDIVLACCILHNFILGVDPEDMLLAETEEVADIDVGDTETMTEPQSQRGRQEEIKQWLDLRDALANEMWQDYCNRH